jgi:hypothetical protein
MVGNLPGYEQSLFFSIKVRFTKGLPQAQPTLSACACPWGKARLRPYFKQMRMNPENRLYENRSPSRNYT